MNTLIHHKYTPRYKHQIQAMKRIIMLLFSFGIIGCSEFVEVDPPKNILISETVFNNPATVESALANIYYGLREQGMLSGSSGLTTGLGIYSDELDYYGFDTDYLQLYNHNVIAGNNRILNWWSEAYSHIYSANDIIKGVENSNALTVEEKNVFKGQALLVRAYIHSLLAALYGDIPYVTSTDYLTNNIISRTPVSEVYDHIIQDLSSAVVSLKGMDSFSSSRVLPNVWVAKVLLARMYLYTEQWDMAATVATESIHMFGLEPDLNKVFLNDSPETIWQFKPGEYPKNTREATQFIIQVIPGQTYALTDELMATFEDGDLRKTYWTNSISDSEGTITLHYAYKYKANLNETESLEYSILLRSAELFLIRAEARAHLGEINGAQQDVNIIRNRAGLPNTEATTINDLLSAILQERRIEFFTEHGHRWFDLKRTGLATETLQDQKLNWQPTDILFPVPESEIEVNPNLLPQNNGYQ